MKKLKLIICMVFMIILFIPISTNTLNANTSITDTYLFRNEFRDPYQEEINTFRNFTVPSSGKFILEGSIIYDYEYNDTTLNISLTADICILISEYEAYVHYFEDTTINIVGNDVTFKNIGWYYFNDNTLEIKHTQYLELEITTTEIYSQTYLNALTSQENQRFYFIDYETDERVCYIEAQELATIERFPTIIGYEDMDYYFNEQKVTIKEILSFLFNTPTEELVFPYNIYLKEQQPNTRYINFYFNNEIVKSISSAEANSLNDYPTINISNHVILGYYSDSELTNKYQSWSILYDTFFNSMESLNVYIDAVDTTPKKVYFKIGNIELAVFTTTEIVAMNDYPNLGLYENIVYKYYSTESMENELTSFELLRDIVIQNENDLYIYVKPYDCHFGTILFTLNGTSKLDYMLSNVLELNTDVFTHLETPINIKTNEFPTIELEGMQIIKYFYDNVVIDNVTQFYEKVSIRFWNDYFVELEVAYAPVYNGVYTVYKNKNAVVTVNDIKNELSVYFTDVEYNYTIRLTYDEYTGYGNVVGEYKITIQAQNTINLITEINVIIKVVNNLGVNLIVGDRYYVYNNIKLTPSQIATILFNQGVLEGERSPHDIIQVDSNYFEMSTEVGTYLATIDYVLGNGRSGTENIKLVVQEPTISNVVTETNAPWWYYLLAISLLVIIIYVVYKIINSIFGRKKRRYYKR